MPGNYPRTGKKKILRKEDLVERMFREERKLDYLATKISAKGEYNCRSLDSAISLAAALNAPVKRGMRTVTPYVSVYNVRTGKSRLVPGEYAAANHFKPRVVVVPKYSSFLGSDEVCVIDEAHRDELTSLIRQEELPFKNPLLASSNVGFEDVEDLEGKLRGKISYGKEIVDPTYTGIAMIARSKPDSIFPNFVRFNDYHKEDYGEEVQTKFTDYAQRHTNMVSLDIKDKVRFEIDPQIKQANTGFAIRSANLFDEYATRAVSHALNFLPLHQRKIYFSNEEFMGNTSAGYNDSDFGPRNIFLNSDKLAPDFFHSGGLHHEVGHQLSYLDNPKGHRALQKYEDTNKKLAPIIESARELNAHRFAYDNFPDRQVYKTAVMNKFNVEDDPYFVETAKLGQLQGFANLDHTERISRISDFSEEASLVSGINPSLKRGYEAALEQSREELQDFYFVAKELIKTFDTIDQKDFVNKAFRAAKYGGRYL